MCLIVGNKDLQILPILCTINHWILIWWNYQIHLKFGQTLNAFQTNCCYAQVFQKGQFYKIKINQFSIELKNTYQGSDQVFFTLCYRNVRSIIVIPRYFTLQYFDILGKLKSFQTGCCYWFSLPPILAIWCQRSFTSLQRSSDHSWSAPCVL